MLRGEERGGDEDAWRGSRASMDGVHSPQGGECQNGQSRCSAGWSRPLESEIWLKLSVCLNSGGECESGSSLRGWDQGPAPRPAGYSLSQSICPTFKLICISAAQQSRSVTYRARRGHISFGSVVPSLEVAFLFDLPSVLGNFTSSLWPASSLELVSAPHRPALACTRPSRVASRQFL